MNVEQTGPGRSIRTLPAGLRKLFSTLIGTDGDFGILFFWFTQDLQQNSVLSEFLYFEMSLSTGVYCLYFIKLVDPYFYCSTPSLKTLRNWPFNPIFSNPLFQVRFNYILLGYIQLNEKEYITNNKLLLFLLHQPAISLTPFCQ